MRFFYLLSGLLALLTTAVQAQYQLRPATLTDRQAQRQTGAVRFYDWDRSPSVIEFIPAGTTAVQAVPAAEVTALRLDNGPAYRGLTMQIPYYKTEALLPGESMIHHIDSTALLAELLLDSPLVQLYRFSDARTKTRYVLVKNDSVVLLHNIELQLIRREGIYNYTEPAFRRELKATLTECPTLNTDRVQYGEKSLIALLSEYLRFCRATPNTQVQARPFARPQVGIGPSAYLLGRVDDYRVSAYVLSVQVLLPKRFHNVFVLFDAGRIRYGLDPYTFAEPLVGLFGGRYIGRGAIQGKIYTGITLSTGLFDTGAGISYRKWLSVEGRYPLVARALNGFRSPMSAFLTVRALVPLSGRWAGSRPGQ